MEELVVQSTTVQQYKKEQMIKKNQYVVPCDGGWAVRGEGNKKVTHVTHTWEESIDIARRIARN